MTTPLPDMLIDSELHRWAEIFRANHISIRSAGMTLDRFLQNPAALLQAIIFDQAFPLEDDEDHYPLLPAQLRVAARVAACDSFRTVAEAMEADLTVHMDVRLHGDHYLQPLKHHAYEVSRGRRSLKAPS